MQDTRQPHRLDNTVIAVLGSEPETEDAISGLAAAGYEYEVLSGEPGRRHLRSGENGGVVAILRRIAAVFGDEHRVLDRLDEALSAGALVVSVTTQPEDAARAVEILRHHGGHYVWKFGEWTFTSVGD
jgi:hypothetical protein